MVADKKVVVIMPAYNAGQTLRKTFDEIPFEVVDEGEGVRLEAGHEHAQLQVRVVAAAHGEVVGTGQDVDAVGKRALPTDVLLRGRTR